jgi:rod shape-determining protein MreD
MNNSKPWIVLLAAYLAVYVEAWFDLPRKVLGAQVDLLTPLMVYAALRNGPGTIALLALFGGWAFDSLSLNPAGASVAPLLAIGWLINRQKYLILADQWEAQFALGLAASAAMPALVLMVLATIGESPLLGWYSLWQWLVVSICGGVVTPVLFRLLDRLNRALSYPVNRPLTFRPDREIDRGKY